MSIIQNRVLTSSSLESMIPIVEKKLDSGELVDIETALLIATGLLARTSDPREKKGAIELIDKALFALELRKLLCIPVN